MERVEKIKKMLESLGYSDDVDVLFTLRRFEHVDKIHSNVKDRDEEQLQEMFELFNKRYGMKIIGKTFPSSRGQLKVKRFLEFLKEYDEKFNLDCCEIDFKELSIKPVYL